MLKFTDYEPCLDDYDGMMVEKEDVLVQLHNVKQSLEGLLKEDFAGKEHFEQAHKEIDLAIKTLTGYLSGSPVLVLKKPRTDIPIEPCETICKRS